MSTETSCATHAHVSACNLDLDLDNSRQEPEAITAMWALSRVEMERSGQKSGEWEWSGDRTLQKTRERSAERVRWASTSVLLTADPIIAYDHSMHAVVRLRTLMRSRIFGQNPWT